MRLEKQEQAAAENRNVRVQLLPVPADAPIAQAINNMGTLTPEERNAMQNLFDIAYMIAYKERPYSGFVDHIEIEKLGGVKFMPGGTYKNDKGCLLFIDFAAKALYETQVKDKLKRANFVTVLAYGATLYHLYSVRRSR